MRTYNQKGFTLIELLLYIAIIGVVLGSAALYFGVVVESRVKNQSIVEVEQQGQLAMEHITQAIRNATAVTSPAAGSSAASLSLTVPTGSLSPTVFSGGTSVLGYNVDGTTTDSENSNNINATKFTAAASGTVSTLYARIGPTVGASPNNKAQMAIYSGATPTTLLASSTDVTIAANSWAAFPISTIAITSGTTYWLAYNTNGTVSTDNSLRYHTGTAGQSVFTSRTYGTWPSSFTGISQDYEFSMYADIATGGGSALLITEGANPTVPLTNSKIQMSGLTFTNLTRSGTPGVVRVSFTLSRVNGSGKNEYDYQKTFTTSAALR